MSVRDLKLKLLLAAGGYVRRFADYLLGASSAPAESADGPPQDWLDRVRRALGPMISHSTNGTTATPPRRSAIVPVRRPNSRNVPERALPLAVHDSIFRQAPETSSIEIPQSEDTRHDFILRQASETPSIEISQAEDVKRQSLPPAGVHYERWRRPLKPKRREYRAPVFSPVADQTPKTSGEPGRSRHTQPPTDNEAVQRAQAAVDPRPSVPLDETCQMGVPSAIELSFEERQSGPESFESRYTLSPWQFHRESNAVIQRDTIHSTFPAEDQRPEWPELSRGVSPAGMRYNDPQLHSSPSIRYGGEPWARPRTRLKVDFRESTDINSAGVQWPEPSPLDWPHLPEETASNEDAELRVLLALEHRNRLDREQGGMIWSEQRF
jgi:hypothetical protein